MEMISGTKKTGQPGNLLINPDFLSSLTAKLETLSNAIHGFSDMLGWEENEAERKQLLQEIKKAAVEASAISEEVNVINGLINENAHPETKSIGVILEQISQFAVPFLCDQGVYFRINIDEGLDQFIIENTYPLKKSICRLIRWAANVNTEKEIYLSLKADDIEHPRILSFKIVFGCEALFYKNNNDDNLNPEERFEFFDDKLGVTLLKTAIESFGGILTFSLDDQNRNAVFQLDIHPE